MSTIYYISTIDIDWGWNSGLGACKAGMLYSLSHIAGLK
jgi:hypothetical protein